MPEADDASDVEHQSRRRARRHLPRERRRRPAREQDRFGGAPHARAHRHRGRVPGRERSQHKNREQAWRVLAARIKDKQMREQQAKEARERKSLIGSGDRSDRIRTYNFPQGRVTDHRINLTLHQHRRDHGRRPGRDHRRARRRAPGRAARERSADERPDAHPQRGARGSARPPSGASTRRCSVAHVLGVDRAYLVANPDARAHRERGRAHRHAGGAARASASRSRYLLGTREFYGRDFAVDRRRADPAPGNRDARRSRAGHSRAIVTGAGRGRSRCSTSAPAAARSRSRFALRASGSLRHRHRLERRGRSMSPGRTPRPMA